MKNRLIRARLARAAAWLLALGTLTTGLVLLLTRTVVVWNLAEGSKNTWEAAPIDVTGIGLALTCTGILVLALALLSEGYWWRHSAYVESKLSQLTETRARARQATTPDRLHIPAIPHAGEAPRQMPTQGGSERPDRGVPSRTWTDTWHEPNETSPHPRRRSGGC